MGNNEKRKEQLRAAQAKFRQIKTNVNAKELEQIEKRIKELNTTKSNYLKTLIKTDLGIIPDKKIKNLSLIDFIKIKFFS